MKTTHAIGDTAENNTLTLPEGMLSIDMEKRALRFHLDGVPGGYEILGTRAYNPPLPGPDTLLAGDTTAGYYGLVQAQDLITGSGLASAVGLSAGTLSSDNIPWLKYSLDEQVMYVALRNIRYDLSWEDIYQVGAVYGTPGEVGFYPSGTPVEQNTQVTINGVNYTVRLLKGAGSDPITPGADEQLTGYDIDLSHGSEWNRLLYPVHSGNHNHTSNPAVHIDSTADPFGSWANFSDADLSLDYLLGNGSHSWTQETTGDDTTHRVLRGLLGVSYLNDLASTNAFTRYAWRPCLVPI